MEQKKLSGAKAPKATRPIQAPSGKTDTKLKNKTAHTNHWNASIS